ncbi:MAG: NUDIX domain-containing protein [Bacteroidales bacterium]|nr:NUDIX domain-containing protein [Bacteroidales bacterium]
MVPIVDTHGVVLGQASRGWCHGGEKPLHPVVHLHILNRNCELYLQKRAMTKDLLPGYWDTAVGGHVSYGESIIEALFREAGEELGFYDFNPVSVTSYVFESQVEKELVNVFAAVGNFELFPNKEEVTEGRFWPFPDIEAHMSPGVFTPNFEQEFRMIRQTLESLL